MNSGFILGYEKALEIMVCVIGWLGGWKLRHGISVLGRMFSGAWVSGLGDDTSTTHVPTTTDGQGDDTGLVSTVEADSRVSLEERVVITVD